jgi:3',5'-cyclic AMP phosphodiesterase CpdA
MLAPLSRYGRYIDSNPEPFYADQEVAIAGINTARSFTIKGGRINDRQVEDVARRFAALSTETVRIVVTHHPFEGARPTDDDGVVGRASMAIRAFSRSRVDLILSGHLHLHRVGSSAVRYDIGGRAALLLQAGTAISHRRRQEANSFNIIRVQMPGIEIESRVWNLEAATFAASEARHFRLGPRGWEPDRGRGLETMVQGTDATVVLPGVREHG